ncbi:MAG: DUF11 domain-containing protein [Rivularia sp. (in: Bacteria)]|nr:DUF11 domain-containing protein [Rivularia sp. MS3]
MKSLLKYLQEIDDFRNARNIDKIFPASTKVKVLFNIKKNKPTSILGRIGQISLISLGIATCGTILSAGEALANMGVTISFPNGQNNITGTQSTELTVQVRNGTFDTATDVQVETQLQLDADLTADAGSTSTTCADGTASFDSGNNKLILSGATIAAQQTCEFKITLTAGRPSGPKTYAFTIGQNTVSTGNIAAPEGTNKDPASVTLTVSPVSDLTGAISFNPGTIRGNNPQPGVATITLNNSNPFDLTAAGFELDLPQIPLGDGRFEGIDFFDTVTGTTCNGGQVTISGGKLVFSNGTIPQDSNCTITFNIKPINSDIFRDGTSYTMEIPGGGVSTAEGISNSAISGDVKVQSGARISASFNENKIISETTSILKLKFENLNGSDITGADFINSLDGNVKITDSKVLSDSCGFTDNLVSGTSDINLTNGTIPAASSCDVEIEVTSDTTGSYSYNVAKGTLDTVEYNATSANLKVVAPVFIDMSFNESNIVQGDQVELTYTLRNESLLKDADITQFTNDLNLGSGYTIVGFKDGNGACGSGNLSQNGTTGFTLSGGTIPKNSSCSFTIIVEAADDAQANVNNQGKQKANTQNVTGGEDNGELITNLGRNSEGASASIRVGGRVRVGKAFGGSTIQGKSTTLTITLFNDYKKTPVDAQIDSFLDDLSTMGNGFTVGGEVTSNCTNDPSQIVAPQGQTEIRLTGGTIPQLGSCTITVPIQVAFNANINKPTNKIEVGGLKTSNLGNNLFIATARLTVPVAVELEAEFIEPKVIVERESQLRLTLKRPAGGNQITDIALANQALPAGYTIAGTPSISNGCNTDAAITANPGDSTFSLSNIDLDASREDCVISFNVKAPDTASVKELKVPKGELTTQQGSTNEADVTASIKAIDPFLIINTSFDAPKIKPGETSRLKIDIINGTSSTKDDFVDLTQLGLINILPPDLFVTDTPNPDFVGSGCTGGASAVTVSPDKTQLTLAGAGITAGSTCQIQIDVTSEYAGNLINAIPERQVESDEGITNPDAVSATLLLEGKADLEIVSKDDGKTKFTPGSSTTYTIIVRNNGPEAVAGVPVKDTAPNKLTIDSWTCTATTGSKCNAESGTGNLDTTVRVLVGGEVTFQVNATVSEDAKKGDKIKNTAQVGPVDGVTDDNIQNNRGSDENNVIIGNPNVLLVKRITGIKPIGATEYTTTSKEGDSLAGYVNDPANFYDDNTLDYQNPDPNNTQFPTKDTDKWPNTTGDTSSTFLIGGINGGKVAPGEELEYTIYYLSSGELEANNVLFCDRVPEKVTFIPNSFNNGTPAAGGLPGADRGIMLLKDGNEEALTNVADGDIARYFPPGVEPSSVYPQIKCDGANTNGAIVVDLGNLPGANGEGNQPEKSYGYVRFRGKVK